MSEPTMPSERVSRERREAVARDIYRAEGDFFGPYFELPDPGEFDPVSGDTKSKGYYRYLADAAITAILPDWDAFETAVDELVDVIKGFEPDSTIEDKKIALRDLVYGADDASGGTR